MDTRDITSSASKEAIEAAAKVRGKIYETDPDMSLNEKIVEPTYIKLDLGCGNNKKPGFTGVDITMEGTQADIACDLYSYPLPWDDSSVGEIFASHFIEHVPNIIGFMNELYRILISGGRINFIAPYYNNIRAMQDPTHKNFISENTFLYYVKGWREANRLEHYPITANFDFLSVRYYYNKEWDTRADSAKEWARIHYTNVVDDIEVVLRAVK